MSKIRFYAADLAAYNNGVLHGVWVDADSDVDAMQDEINAMLRKSPCPNVMVPDYEATARAAGWSDDHNALMPTHKNGAGYWVKPGKYDDDGEPTGYNDAELVCNGEGLAVLQVPSAEEWAMHDSDGLPWCFGEHIGLKAIAEYAELAEELEFVDNDDLKDIVDNFGNIETAKSTLNENYRGVYDSFREYADECASEMLAQYGNEKDTQWLVNYFDYDAFARDLEMETTKIHLRGFRVAVFSA